MQFTQQELQAILTLLLRVDLKGNEATSVAVLQQKIQQMINSTPLVATEKPVTKE